MVCSLLRYQHSSDQMEWQEPGARTAVGEEVEQVISYLSRCALMTRYVKSRWLICCECIEVECKFPLKAEQNAFRPFIEKDVFVILSTGFGLIYQLANCVKMHLSGGLLCLRQLLGNYNLLTTFSYYHCNIMVIALSLKL